jgi:type VI protein secretion system component VasF
MGLPKYRIPTRAPRPASDLMRTALLRASRLTPAEIADIMQPLRFCAARLREGVGSEIQLEVLRTTMRLALEIDLHSHFRGLREHINTAQVALSAVRDRAMSSGAWVPTAMQLHEIDALNSMLELHETQLLQLSAAELQRFTKRLVGQTTSQGGEFHSIQAADIGMEVQP